MEVESHSGPKFLPFESVAVVLNGIKLTTDVGLEVRYRLGKEGVKWLYTKPRDVVQGTNRGGLGWSSKRFHSVAWHSLEAALKSKPDMFQIWLSKQCIGICATQRNMTQIQDILDDKCLNCLRPRDEQPPQSMPRCRMHTPLQRKHCFNCCMDAPKQ